MSDIDFNALSIEDLIALRKRADKAIASFEERKRKEALEAAEAAAKARGFTLAELTGARKITRRAASARYQHPNKPGLAWSGRGRRPAWLNEAIEAGKSKEDFAVR